MRIEKFSGSGDVVLEELRSAIFFDLVEGADPEEMAHYLVDPVGLAPDGAQQLVGGQNNRLQHEMEWAADQLLERQVGAGAVINQLIERNWPRAVAESFVARVQADLARLAQSADGRAQLLAKYRRGMLYGIAWFGGGAFATWITGYAAEHGQGSYQLLAWAPICFGIAQFSTSAFRWCRLRLSQP